MHLINRLLCSLSLLTSSLTYAESPAPSLAFNYSQATNIIVYTHDGQQSIWFPKPLEIEHSRGPAILYRDILFAITNSSPTSEHSENHQFIIDIITEQRYKRLYLHDTWISDGFIIYRFDEINPVLEHIKKRFQIGTPANYTIRHTALKFPSLTSHETRTQASQKERISAEQARERVSRLITPTSESERSTQTNVLSSASPHSSITQVVTAKHATVSTPRPAPGNETTTDSSTRRAQESTPDEMPDKTSQNPDGRAMLVWRFGVWIALIVVLVIALLVTGRKKRLS